MRRTLIICLIAFFFIIQLSQAQNYKIELRPLKTNLTFDSIKAKESELLVTIFYKNFGKSDCDNSRILEFSNKECNINSFKEKLVLSLNKSSFIFPLRVQIFYWDNVSSKVYFIEDEYGKKSFNNKNNLEVEDQMAFIDFANMSEFIKIESFTKELNRIAKTHLLEDTFKVKSLFEFTKTLKKKGVVPFNCPNEIRALYKDSATMYSSNTCPSASIPLDDMFLEHLTLIFRPNTAINIATRIISQNQNINIIQIDSLKQILENQKKEVEELKNVNSSNKNNLSISSNYSLFSIGSSSNDLSSDLKTGFVSGFGISYSRTFSSGFGFGISLNNLNANGTLNTTELEVEHQEVLPSSTVVMNKKTNIFNLTENWNLDNAIGLNLGFNFKKAIGKKVNLFMDIELGKILNSNIRTTLQEGVFNYRASIPGIEDEIFNIASLDLKENVTYSDKFNQKFGFKGSSLSIGVDVEYSFFKNIFVNGGFQFEYYKLKNTDYNSESKVSTSLGDFNSSFNNVKSITLLPFSIGLGVGIKF